MLFHVISVIHVLISTFGISQMVRRTKKRTYLFQLSKKAPSIVVVYWLGGCGLPPRLVPTWLGVTGWYQRRMGYWYYSWFIWPKIWSAKITKNKHKLRFCNSFNWCIFGSGTKRSKHHKCHKWLKLISPILPSTQKNIEKCWREISQWAISMAVWLAFLHKGPFRSSQLNLLCKYQHLWSHEPFVARYRNGETAVGRDGRLLKGWNGGVVKHRETCRVYTTVLKVAGGLFLRSSFFCFTFWLCQEKSWCFLIDFTFWRVFSVGVWSSGSWPFGRLTCGT